MAREPVEVEVLDKDGAPLVKPEPRRGPLTPVINTLAFVFAALTAVMLVLLATAAVLLQQAQKEDEELPPDQE